MLSLALGSWLIFCFYRSVYVEYCFYLVGLHGKNRDAMRSQLFLKAELATETSK